MDTKPYTLRYLTTRDIQGMRRRATLEGADQWKTWRTLAFPSRSAAKRWLRQHRPAAVSDSKPLPWTNYPPLAGGVRA